MENETMNLVTPEVESDIPLEAVEDGPKKTDHHSDLIDFYEGRGTGESLAHPLWSKIREAQLKGVTVPEVDRAYREREAQQQRDTLSEAVQDALGAIQPITPDYFPPGEDQVEARVQQRLAEIELEKVFVAHERRVTETKSSHPDYEEAFADYGHLPISTPIQEAIIRLENGPEVMYEAAKTGVIEDLLTRMSPVQAVAELGRISARLEGHEGPAVTRATPPPQPLKRATAKPVDIYDPDLPFRDFVKAREASLKRR